MSYLSFDDAKKARPIAIVKGGDYDGETLYLHESLASADDPKKKVPRAGLVPRKYEAELKDIKPTERVKVFERLTQAVKNNVAPHDFDNEDEPIRRLYERMYSETKKDTAITLPPDTFFVPCHTDDKTRREIYYITGASGSGKSYFTRNIAESYHRNFKDRPIYLISKLNVDETLDKSKCPIHRINIETLVDNPVHDIEEFRESLVIFDDWDCLNKPYITAVQKLIEDLLTMGRHTITSCCLCMHNTTNYKQTRLMLVESHYIVVYPQATSNHALSYLLKSTVGLDKDELKDIKKLGSRWVVFSKTFPQFMISEHTAKLLHS